jgi:regulator of replication initiation timing
MPRIAHDTLFRTAFKATLDKHEEELDYDVICDLLAEAAVTTYKQISKKTSAELSAAAQQVEALTGERDAATAEVAALRARIAELEAAPKPAKAKAAAKPRPKHGRMQNQILKVNLNEGETVYRKVGGETYTAIWSKADATLTCAALDATFTSPSSFAVACAKAVFADDKSHAVNGWDVCWVERDGKKYKLSALRTAAAPPAEEEAEEAAPAHGGAGHAAEDDAASAGTAATGEDEEEAEDE